MDPRAPAAVDLLAALDGWERALDEAQEVAYVAQRPLPRVMLRCTDRSDPAAQDAPHVQIEAPLLASAHAHVAWKDVERTALATLQPAADLFADALHRHIPVLTGPMGVFSASWGHSLSRTSWVPHAGVDPLVGRASCRLQWRQKIGVNAATLRTEKADLRIVLLLIVRFLHHLGPTQNVSHTVHGQAVPAASPEEALLFFHTLRKLENALMVLDQPSHLA